MTTVPADSPPLPPPPGEAWLPGPKPPDEGWTAKKFYTVLALVLVFHVALIFVFGTKKQIIPRVVANVPHLQFTDGANELLALGDPTLFARPNMHDVVTAFWRRIPAVAQPDFNWTEAPRYLPPAPGALGITFAEYMRNHGAGELPMNFKPAPKLIVLALPLVNTMPQATTWQITGELAQRRLFTTNELQSLPSLPRNDVLAPTRAQALVDTTGNVASAVVLESSGDSDADQLALQVVRHLRFAAAPGLMFGEITFTWHTVPTNAVPASVP